MPERRHSLDRRHVLLALGAGAGLLSLARVSASTLALTARQSLGPFYPAEPPAKRDNDLTRVAGRTESAKGVSAEHTC